MAVKGIFVGGHRVGGGLVGAGGLLGARGEGGACGGREVGAVGCCGSA